MRHKSNSDGPYNSNTLCLFTPSWNYPHNSSLQYPLFLTSIPVSIACLYNSRRQIWGSMVVLCRRWPKAALGDFCFLIHGWTDQNRVTCDWLQQDPKRTQKPKHTPKVEYNRLESLGWRWNFHFHVPQLTCSRNNIPIWGHGSRNNPSWDIVEQGKH